MPLDLSNAPSGSAHALGTGEDVVLRLAENPGTGYRWEFMQSGMGELVLVENRFAAGAAAAAPGAAGERTVRFQARRPGEVVLEVVSRRSWEPLEASTERRTYRVVVR